MKFTIPANAAAKPFKKHWKFCVGSGHAALAMRTDYCEQLKQIHDDLGIERVRFHGIFSDDMHTYDTMATVMPMPGAEQIPFYESSFRLPGLVYDNVLKAGMKPFVELSFMPSQMAKRPTRGTFYWKPCIAPPKDEAQWQAHIQKFIRFLLNRYGREEVESWFFEVWNEPDLKTPFFDGTQKEYFRLYEITVRAIKEVDDKLKVGGPATSNSKWISAFVQHCKEHSLPVDFITTHQYAGDPISEMCNQSEEDHNQTTEEIQQEYQVDMAQLFAGLKPEDGLLPMFRRVMPENTETADLNRDLLRDAALQVRQQANGLPVYYTEWNACATFGAPGNDTRKIAAYDVRAALCAEDALEGSSVWCFSDIFEELHPFPEEFHGGFGMMSQHGIPKPVYHALRLLNQAGDERLELPGALDGEISTAAFCDAAHTQLTVMTTKQNLHHFAELQTPATPVELEVTLDAAPKSVEICRIDEEHGNPLKCWQLMGEPEDLTPAQVQQITAESAVTYEKLPFTYENGAAHVTFSLGTNDIAFVRFVK